MNKKWVPYILILLMAVTVLLIKRCTNSKEPAPKSKTNNTGSKPKDPASGTTNRDRGFDRRTSYLEYSSHAKCRMQCRKISQAEVEEVMKAGTINYKKSDLKNARCPRYALEAMTADDQDVRIVFAQCNEKTVVVTVIDLDRDLECSCPGDDNDPASSPRKN